MPRTDIHITSGQLRVFLNMTPDPAAYTPEVSSFVAAVHQLRAMGNGWKAEMTDADVEEALRILEEHARNNRSAAASGLVRFFMKDNPAAHRVHEAREERAATTQHTATTTSPEGDQA